MLFEARKDAAIEGLKSKTHMKVQLKWMWGRQIIQLSCTQAGNMKKLLPVHRRPRQQHPKKGWKGKHPKYKVQAKKQPPAALGSFIFLMLFLLLEDIDHGRSLEKSVMGHFGQMLARPGSVLQ